MSIKSIFMLSVAVLGLAACNDKEEVVSVSDIAGQYEGYAVANCTYFQNSVSEGETVSVSENSDGTAKVTFASDTWGEIVVDNARAGKSGGKYTLTGGGKATMGMGGNSATNDCTLSAEIVSTDDASMTFSVPAVMGGLTVEFRTGDVPADLIEDK